MKVLPFNIPKQDNVALIYQEDFTDIFYDKLHQHEEIQLSYIAKGTGTLVIGDSINKYEMGDVIIIGSNIPHVFKSDPIKNEKSLMLSLFVNNSSLSTSFFELDEFESLQSFFKNAIYGLKVISNIEQLKDLFLQLKKVDKLERFIIFFKILQTISNSNYQQLSSFIYPKNYSNAEGERMSKVVVYTMSHYDQPISLSQISSIANLSPNAFCKYFKSRTNKTYVQFLTEIRVEHACKLLSKTHELTILDIALASGFTNISNFNRKFKSLKKKTPLHYKKTYSF